MAILPFGIQIQLLRANERQDYHTQLCLDNLLNHDRKDCEPRTIFARTSVSSTGL